MLSHIQKVLVDAEGQARAGVVPAAWSNLRRLCLDDFGEFMLNLPCPAYPSLSALLPSMASGEVQRNWTGNEGYPLLKQTLSFVRSVRYNFTQFTNRSLDRATILDFGCGYGRIARLIYHFTDPAHLYCVDPWDESIRLCKESRMLGNFAVSEYLPTSLPFPGVHFDLIYCFSVFTHLSYRATRAALDTLHKYIKPDGVAVITIRPEDYWKSTRTETDSLTSAELVARHRRNEFAFVPHNRAPIDGDVTYGDTSFSLAWFEHEFPEWRIVQYDRSLDDPFQVLLFLAPQSIQATRR